MAAFEKAVDFYLRGFNSTYIKRRTGISMQSLLKRLLASGIKYTKDDIFEYQKQYIESHFTKEVMEQEYRRVSKQFDDIYKASRGRNVVFLGCGFGNYKRVLTALLGKERYDKLRNECWHDKQIKSVKQKYGVSNVFCKDTFSKFVSEEAVQKGRDKRLITLECRYGVSAPNANPEIKARMLETKKKTNLERYGVEHVMQNPKIAYKSNKRRMEVMKERYGAGSSVQIPEIRNKIFEARVKNNTVNSSVPENVLYDLLIDKFGKEDIVRNALVDSRYPFHVDFYIKSRDMFIELNGDAAHNDHWFDASNSRDTQIVRAWEENMLRIETQTGKKSRYRKYIETWTDRDVRKRNIAKTNKLNYLVFWDGSCKQHNKKQLPRLSDVHEWFDAGCPDSYDWKLVNTY